MKLLSRLMLLFCCCLPMSAQAAEPLRFAYQDRIGDALSIIAVKKNLFTAEGLQVKPLLFNNGPACSEALFTGAVDVATMGDTTAVSAVTKVPDLRIIGSHGAGESRHRIMVPANSTMQRIEDLKGKRLGVKKGTSTHGGLLVLLKTRGIAVGELKLVELDPDTMPAALAAGSLDAFVASEPTPSLAEQQGARELTTLAGLGNSYPLLIVAKSATLQKREAELKKFFRALARAEQFLVTHRNEAVMMLSQATGLTPEMTRRAMQRHSYRLQLDPHTLASLEQTAAFLKEQKKISQTPAFTKVMDTRFVSDLKKTGK